MDIKAHGAIYSLDGTLCHSFFSLRGHKRDSQPIDRPCAAIDDHRVLEKSIELLCASPHGPRGSWPWPALHLTDTLRLSLLK